MVGSACVGWLGAWCVARSHTREHNDALRAERAGRLKAERLLSAAAPSAATTAATAPLAVVPVGVIRSPYADRNGAPRQPGVVKSSVSTLRLHPNTSPTMLKGLSGYSHVFVVFWFHLNTNAAKSSSKVKAVVQPPRAQGEAVGVFACRTPHRPNPLGLSLCEVLSVDEAAGTVTVAGLDVIDHTPLIDIKPYIPFAERPDSARCPQWVEESYTSEETFKHYTTVFTADAELDVEHYEGVQRHCTSLKSLITDTLHIDFRSARQQSLQHFEGSLRLNKVTVFYTLDVPSQTVTVTSIKAKGAGEESQ